MKTTSIQIPSQTIYLSEALNNSLPKNCLFNKGKVGAGGTTIALTSEEDYIIAVPYVALIQNKVEQSKDNTLYPYKILGVYGETSKVEIEEYLKSNHVKKIMVTYDSLPKVTEVAGFDMNLLIDEYHLLFKHSVFRAKAVRNILDSFSKFKSYCFMTATELEDTFILDELKELDRIVAVWETSLEVTVKPVIAKNSVLKTTAGVIDKFLNGQIEGNAYFFLNSVSMIEKLVATCKLNDENCRVIYSKYNPKKLKVTNGFSTDKPKKINLITSTAFEGADFYDLDAKLFVVSCPSNANTLVSIETDLNQIAGRVRNTKYIDTIIHIFKHTRYSDLSYEEYLVEYNGTLKRSSSYLDGLNNLLTEDARIEHIRANKLPSKQSDHFESEHELNPSFYYLDNDIIKFDHNKHKLDLYNYKVTRGIYTSKVNLGTEYINAGFKLKGFYQDDTDLKIIKAGNNFKDTVELLEAIWDDHYNLCRLNVINAAYAAYPFLSEAIKQLGFDKMRKMQYVVNQIKRKLVADDSNTSESIKILKSLRLNNSIRKGDFIASSKLKEVFTKIYADLGISKTAKGTDIERFYEIKLATKRDGNKVINGYNIIGEKIVITSK
ncbi:hypothetical protein [Algoriphagus aquimarinus]|uniref:hypothetical protein n=1 Tax=Algoriphagus aquimarinus TaxID=237018 RepID=UPI0030D91724|tara:strand:- start:170 stop:1987 length:1818 start_codon:yes stop_codon:yes gene_type:complete